jgi:hypothetical protein
MAAAGDGKGRPLLSKLRLVIETVRGMGKADQGCVLNQPLHRDLTKISLGKDGRKKNGGLEIAILDLYRLYHMGI